MAEVRKCGICKRPVESAQPLRIEADDIPGKVYERGLYSACEECVAAAKPAIAARLGVTVENLTSVV